jgi:fatty-acyl-CoA synthase
MVQAEQLRVVDEDMRDVPRDGTTMGEIVMRGNNVMLGYHADPGATEHAFRGGWFHSGDLGVMEPDGYVRLLDRSKDVVISGGENISTVEVEQALLAHPAVEAAAVIGIPDEEWGERPRGVRRPAAGRGCPRSRTHRPRPRADRALQGAQGRGVPRRAADDKHREIQGFALREREWAGHEARIRG